MNHWTYDKVENIAMAYDDLHMTYEGNMLTSVRDSASRLPYSGATDFDGVPGQEYPLAYNASGSLVSDAGRGIARIDYDRLNNPVRIQFTDGSVTSYIYSAAGEKLRVIHQTAVPNISVAIGSTRELAPSEVLSADSTDYLLGGSLTLRNGRIDKLQFDEGYCQASAYSGNATQDDFSFHYYDHLGNIRQVVRADRTTNGTLVQTMDHYPFGAQFCHSSTASEVQSRKYNGKEFDKMHGLDTYDYGARQYDPVTARWDRVDPLCEKYYDASPYAYCGGNPVKYVDSDGREKKEYLSYVELHESDYDMYPENTPGVINIWAHGVKEKNEDNYAWSIKVVRGRNVKNASEFENSVLKYSKEWKKNNGEDIIIVLHSCSSSNLAREMSGDKQFKGKNITIIAPNATLKPNKKGSKVNSKVYYKGDKKNIVGREEGKWMAYKDGKLVNTLPADAQPGMTDKAELERILKK